MHWLALSFHWWQILTSLNLLVIFLFHTSCQNGDQKTLCNHENHQPPPRTAEGGWDPGKDTLQRAPGAGQGPGSPGTLCVAGLWKFPPTPQSLEGSVVNFCEFCDITVSKTSRFAWNKSSVLYFHRWVLNQTIDAQVVILENRKLSLRHLSTESMAQSY